MQNKIWTYLQTYYVHKYAQNMHKYAKPNMHEYEFSNMHKYVFYMHKYVLHA